MGILIPTLTAVLKIICKQQGRRKGRVWEAIAVV